MPQMCHQYYDQTDVYGFPFARAGARALSSPARRINLNCFRSLSSAASFTKCEYYLLVDQFFFYYTAPPGLGGPMRVRKEAYLKEGRKEDVCAMCGLSLFVETTTNNETHIFYAFSKNYSHFPTQSSLPQGVCRTRIQSILFSCCVIKKICAPWKFRWPYRKDESVKFELVLAIILAPNLVYIGWQCRDGLCGLD